MTFQAGDSYGLGVQTSVGVVDVAMARAALGEPRDTTEVPETIEALLRADAAARAAPERLVSRLPAEGWSNFLRLVCYARSREPSSRVVRRVVERFGPYEETMMAEMTPRERVRCVLAGELPDRVPYVEVGVDFPFISRLLGLNIPAGRFFEAGEYESPPIEIQLQINQILHRDNLAYGMLPPIPAVKRPGEDGILYFKDGKIKSWEDLDQLQLPDPSSETFLAPARRFLEAAGDYATVCTSRIGISPTYLAMGMEHFFYCLYDDPALINELLQRYTDFAVAVAEQAAQLGFDMFWTSDDIAFRTGPLFSPKMFRELMLPHIRRVADRIREAGIAWAYHSDGNLTPLMEDLLALGIHVLNPIEAACMDIRDVKKRYGDRVILCGNVDVDLLTAGTPEQVREVTLGLLRDVAPGGGYILASGNSVTSYCSVDCVRTMCDTVYEFGHYPIQG